MIWMTEVILQRGETYHDKPDWDAPGTLHHVIIRGIERKEIVKDDHDRQNFVYRMGTIALERRILHRRGVKSTFDPY
jgi:hypothetical protein